MSDIELANVGVLRGATRSIESLDRFGSEELVKLAQAVSDDRSRQAYLARYAEIFERERGILWDITAADDRFIKALTIANRLVADKVRAYLPIWQQQSRTKTIRRLEHTLYRYLARAVGRTTPNGLWAGVGVVRCGDSTSVKATAAEYYFTPDLRPFGAILRSLGTRSSYRQRSYWQVNPTLKQCREGWQFWERNSGTWCQIASEPEIDICLQAMLELPPLKWEEIVAKIDRLPPLEIGEWLDAAIDIGAIVGGLDLPPRFDTVWDGLLESGEKLIGVDRDLWELTIDRLHSLCMELSARWDEIDPAELALYLDTARSAIVELIAELAISIETIDLPDNILKCDLKLPWEITLDRQQWEQLAETIAIYNRDWLDRTSPAMELRRQQRADLRARLQTGIELNSIEWMAQLQSEWQKFTAINANEDPSATYFHNWTEILTSSIVDIYLKTESNSEVDPTATAPLGCFYFTPLAEWQLIIKGIEDDPARAFVRFGKFLDRTDELHEWMQQKLSKIGSRYHLNLVELYVASQENPNINARRKLVTEAIDLWGANPDCLSLKSAKIQLDRYGKSPILSLPSQPDPLAVFFFCTANISENDSLSNLLLYSGFQERPLHFSPSSIPIAAELERKIYTPRVRLQGGEILRPRRTTLDRQTLEKLVNSSPAERYLMWQNLAGKLAWSRLVNIQIDYAPGLLIKSDSPLAIEAVFKKIEPDSQWAIVEEVSDLPWLVDRDGKHYAIEFAIPFQRSKHAWASEPQAQ